MNDFYDDWNEYNWETELRKDDARIAEYIKTIPHFVDLPGEEDILLKRLQSNPKLVSQTSEWLAKKELNDDAFMVDEDLFFSDDWKKREGANIYIEFEKLAAIWNVFFISEINNPENIKISLKITCLYGKLIARTADIVDLSENNISFLKIAITKRIVFGINELIGELINLQSLSKTNLKIIESHTSHLQIVREKAIDYILDLRKKD